jgi:uncharacterized NAD(P)/FAD-binding protein YdhS
MSSISQQEPKIAVIGGGPMALYTLYHLYTKQVKCKITLFDPAERTGTGMPFSSYYNGDYMMCNAFSREIPPIIRPLSEWLKMQSDEALSRWDVHTDDVRAREFYPRTLVGEYLHAEFTGLQDAMNRHGQELELKKASVEDILPAGKKKTVRYTAQGETAQEEFDIVVIATGHEWDDQPEVDGVKLICPWPYTAVENLRQNNIGILGSSLSAIDSVLALAHSRGRFEAHEDHMDWLPHNNNETLTITMVSFDGIMPEGDFYYEYPYDESEHLTEEAVNAEAEKGDEGLLLRLYGLLYDELRHGAPGYLEEIGARRDDIESFREGYFRKRKEIGGLNAVAEDYEDVRDSKREKTTIPHRYVLLKVNGIFETAIPFLNEKDHAEFMRLLMPVFADCYAAIPHISLKKMLALREAGILFLTAVKEDNKFEMTQDQKVRVETIDGEKVFDCLIDSRGQKAKSLKDIRFPSIVAALEENTSAVIAPFHLGQQAEALDGIYCLAMPQVLVKYPFSQGLGNCDALSELVAEDIERRLS